MSEIEELSSTLEDQYFFIGKKLFKDGHFTHAFHYLKKCTQNPQAQFFLFLIHFNHPTKLNQPKAIRRLIKAVNQGLSIAQNCLGYCYEKGLGVAKNLEQAFSLYKQSATGECIESYFNLGRIYHKGIGIPPNSFEAIRYFTLILQTNPTPTLLKKIYFFDDFMDIDWLYEFANCSTSINSKLYDWTKALALKGVSSAQYHFGVLLIYQAIHVPIIMRSTLSNSSPGNSNPKFKSSRSSHVSSSSLESHLTTFCSQLLDTNNKIDGEIFESLQWEALEYLLKSAINGCSSSIKALKIICKSELFSAQYRGHISFCLGKLYQEHHFVISSHHPITQINSLFKMKYLQISRLGHLLHSWQFKDNQLTLYSWLECLRGNEVNLQISGSDSSRLSTSNRDGSILYSPYNLFLFKNREQTSLCLKEFGRDWSKALDLYYFGNKLGHLESQLQLVLLCVNIVSNSKAESTLIQCKCVKLLENLIRKDHIAANYELSRLFLVFDIDARLYSKHIDEEEITPSDICYLVSLLDNFDQNPKENFEIFSGIEQKSSFVERNLLKNVNMILTELDAEECQADFRKMQMLKGFAFMKSAALSNYIPAQFELGILLEHDKREIPNFVNPFRLTTQFKLELDAQRKTPLSEHRKHSFDYLELQEDNTTQQLNEPFSQNRKRASVTTEPSPIDGTRVFKKTPYEWCLLAANAGWAPAQYKLARDLQTRQFSQDDSTVQRIRIWIKKANEKGYAPAVLSQTKILFSEPKFGVSHSQSIQKMIHSLKGVACDGCVEAQIQLAALYLKKNQYYSKTSKKSDEPNSPNNNNDDNNDNNNTEGNEKIEDSKKKENNNNNTISSTDEKQSRRRSFFNSRENYSKINLENIVNNEINNNNNNNNIENRIVNNNNNNNIIIKSIELERIKSLLSSFNWSVRAAHLGSYDGLLNLVHLIGNDNLLNSVPIYTPYTYLQIYYIAASRRLERTVSDGDINLISSIRDLQKLLEKNKDDYKFAIVCSIALAILFEKHCKCILKSSRAYYWWNYAWKLFHSHPKLSLVIDYLYDLNTEEIEENNCSLNEWMTIREKSTVPYNLSKYYILLLWKLSNSKIEKCYHKWSIENNLNVYVNMNNTNINYVFNLDNEEKGEFEVKDQYNIKEILASFTEEFGLFISHPITKSNLYPILYTAVINNDVKTVRSFLDRFKEDDLKIEDVTKTLQYANSKDLREIRLMLSRIVKENSLEKQFKEYLDQRTEEENSDDLFEYQEIFVLLNQLEEISSKDILLEEKKLIAKYLEGLGAIKAASIAKDLKPILKAIHHPELLLNHQPSFVHKIFTKYVGNKYFAFSGIFKSINQLIKMIQELIHKYMTKNKEKYQQIITSLTQIIAIYEAKREQIMQSNNPEGDNLFRTPTMIYIAGVGIRILDRKAADCLLPEDTSSFIGHEEYGSHIIRKFNNIHFKGDPHSPGVEFTVDSLNKIIAGQGSTPIELIKVYQYIHPSFDPTTAANFNYLNINESQLQKNEMIYLASKTVRGANLQFIIDQHPEYIYSNNIVDSCNFSAVVISSLLTNPHDGKPENFMVQLKVDQNKSVKKIFIVGIDNDIAFADPIIFIDKGPRKGYHQAGVKNILYFFPQMKNSLDSNFINLFLKNKPEIIIILWLSSIILKNQNYRQLLDEGVFSQEDFENLHLPIQFVKGTVIDMYHRLCLIHQELTKDPNISHLDLFYKVQPLLFYYYEGIKLKVETTKKAASFQIYNYYSYLSSIILQCVSELYASKPPTVEEIFSLLRHYQIPPNNNSTMRSEQELQDSNFTSSNDPNRINLSDENEFKRMALLLQNNNSTLYHFEEERNISALDELQSFLAELDYQHFDYNYHVLLLTHISDFKTLDHLTFRNSSLIDYSMLHRFLEKMTQLQSLTLISCPNFDENNLKILLEKFPKLSIILS